MGIYSNNIKPILKRKDILIRLIVINIGVFLLLAAFNILKLFHIDIADTIISYIALPARLDVLLTRFWTPLTYMFAHQNVLHILFNMLMLYWFGQLFLMYFNPKNLGSLYIIGGLAGAALYLLLFNTIPMLVEMNYSIMLGASASVMAIIFAVAFYKPDQEVMLFIFGRVKIIYIALVLLVLDLIGISSISNVGGHIAHIGGAIVGYIYAKQYLRGKDITKWLNKTIDWIVNLFKPRNTSKKMKVKYKKPETDYEYNQRHNNEAEAIDRILDKIKASGYTSLSAEEKKRLFDASNRK
ncbi:membrane associated rhomboid family serine protease [Dysgonomonas sp. PFB1-18]|uniref:rhomboid family intramembrane serine protease n=1 Tax=unclassified Dysgonomonas TaxID=2630389 RepID=UPI00247305BD|nr:MULTISPECIES: rhomboid family intramembrane serine protease [unclassified Dysgonomonas]MDH6310707.1 membrane associated rhomboid family serine protease [Dysgonomonas sp. PF1-14]MDH6340558.1 membrane associated rhomboid family serine protease [Dysgonomonas sp. PF1-16]MDH6382186.1 membrane associated rhomboid family serine protease [Dysgonomonas sp. PFB1-18]MDH6399529.1 membrane associated rhomboid family serine protease [Dysgonomonas sp. PF1-23]